MKNRQATIICTAMLVLSFVMNIVDVFIRPGYFVKSVIKITLFGGAAGVYFVFNRNDFYGMKPLFNFDIKKLKLPFLLGIVCYVGIAGGYILLQDYLDFSRITGKLASDMGVTAQNFIWVSLYIALCNSFLEEFFFRCFGFMVLKKHAGRNFAYIFSRVVFAFYHVGMTLGWVNILLYAAGFAGLVMGGMIFNSLNEETGSIYSSWIVHMFINFGINTVGFILFGIL